LEKTLQTLQTQKKYVITITYGWRVLEGLEGLGLVLAPASALAASLGDESPVSRV
jgi:hypothetical protein